MFTEFEKKYLESKKAAKYLFEEFIFDDAGKLSDKNNAEKVRNFVVTKFHRAAARGDVAELAFFNGNFEPYINIKDTFENAYPLHLVIQSGNPLAIKMLLTAKNVDFSVKNAVGQTPLDMALDSGKLEIIKLVALAGAPFDGKAARRLEKICFSSAKLIPTYTPIINSGNTEQLFTVNRFAPLADPHRLVNTTRQVNTYGYAARQNPGLFNHQKFVAKSVFFGAYTALGLASISSGIGFLLFPPNPLTFSLGILLVGVGVAIAIICAIKMRHTINEKNLHQANDYKKALGSAVERVSAASPS